MNEVAKNILIKAGVIEGDKRNLKIGILATGGAQSGVFSGGVLCEMIDLGLSDKFDVAVGLSASAPNIAHFLTQNKSAVSTYWEDNIDGLIKLWRFWEMVDLNYLDFSLHNRKPINVSSVLHNPTEFYVGVTNLYGKGELINVKKSLDIIDPIIASCSLPIFWNKPWEVNGKLYLNGEVGMSLPVRQVSEHFGLTDLLVIINSTPENFSKEYSFFTKLLAHFELKKFPPEFTEKFSHQKTIGRESLALTNGGVLPNGCRVAVINPSYDINKISTDVETLKNFAEEGKRKAKEFFQK